MGRWYVLVLLLALVRPVAADEEDELAGMDAAVRGDWASACESFEKAKGGLRAGLRLNAARGQANARLKEAISDLTREKKWRQLAEAAACGMLADPSQRSYASAAKRAAKEGAAEVAPTDPHVRPWAIYGRAFGDAEALAEGCFDYLVKTQEADGRWSGPRYYDAGLTALAVLALVSDRPEAAGRGAKALVAMQNGDGTFGKERNFKGIYGDALAVEALAEYALRAGDKETFRDALERGTEALVDAQTPHAGWRYEARGNESDTSVTERVVAALCAAQRGGISVDPEALEGARTWVLKMTEPNYGQIGYNYPGGAPARPESKQDAFPPEKTQSMTAAGCLIFLFTGSDPVPLAPSFACVFDKLPTADPPDMYYWALGARACVDALGQMPLDWYATLVKSAAACRAEDGGMRACGPWGEDAGRVYATAITALALTAPCRATPKLSVRPFLESGRCVIKIPGYSTAIPTGIYVDSGSVLSVSASGTIVTYDGGPGISPEGTREKVRGSAPRDRQAPFGCLLGRIDDGEPFALAIGKKSTLRATGHLWLMVNDETTSDNFGWWDVTIERPQ